MSISATVMEVIYSELLKKLRGRRAEGYHYYARRSSCAIDIEHAGGKPYIRIEVGEWSGEDVAFSISAAMRAHGMPPGVGFSRSNWVFTIEEPIHMEEALDGVMAYLLERGAAQPI